MLGAGSWRMVDHGAPIIMPVLWLAPATGRAPENASTSLGFGGAITLHGFNGGMTGTLQPPDFSGSLTWA
ncbi:hypothetical protein PoB_000531300 [Plakobranchus ocellatus]|uniref:Uncharacterized protein n=1 Tax=Plakobranchus ocellatus TaxID=259542 RepID=A0AAV3Y8P1_9GAST|nr:hypothetical protein PoB_000531300 [Plakobranchus ocellatus]